MFVCLILSLSIFERTLTSWGWEGLPNVKRVGQAIHWNNKLVPANSSRISEMILPLKMTDVYGGL